MSDSSKTAGGATAADGKLRFLVVVAHPHDFTHCAGTCGIHTSRGDDVTAVSVTSGANTHNERLYDELRKPPEQRDPHILNQTKDQYAEKKAKEFRAICALFGVTDGRILGYEQPFRVARTPEVIETLRDVIYEIRPHVLITQRPHLAGRHQKVSAAGNDEGLTAVIRCYQFDLNAGLDFLPVLVCKIPLKLFEHAFGRSDDI